MSIDYRTVERTITDVEVQLQGEWFNSQLIEDLVELFRWRGFGPGIVSYNGEDYGDNYNTQIELLEKKGLASQSTGGSWYGTETLVRLVKAQGGLP